MVRKEFVCIYIYIYIYIAVIFLQLCIATLLHSNSVINPRDLRRFCLKQCYSYGVAVYVDTSCKRYSENTITVCSGVYSGVCSGVPFSYSSNATWCGWCLHAHHSPVQSSQKVPVRHCPWHRDYCK